MGRFVRLAAACGVLVGTGAASLGVGTALAAPTPGNPTDHFQNRRSIGQEGLFILGNGASSTPVGVNRLNTANNGGEELQSRVEEDSFPIGTGPFDIVEADLATVADPNDPSGQQRPALEPGAATFGAPVSDAPCQPPGPGQTPLCLAWQPPIYADPDPSDTVPRTFAELGPPLTLTLGNLANVAPRSDVSVVAGTFDSGGGTSLMVSWVESVGANTDLRIAHVIVSRDGDGNPQSLELDGVSSLGSVLEDQAPDGSRRVTSAGLAAGDFTRSGSDQLAVTWAPPGSANGARRFTAALYGVAPGGGPEELIAPQTINASIFGSPNASPLQFSPGAVALHDARGEGPARDRLVIGPGIFGESGLYSLTPNAGSPMTFDVNEVNFNTVVVGQPYLLDHSDLEAAGDLDGDGLEELVSTTHELSFDGTNRIEILNIAPGGVDGGLFSRSWLGEFPGLQIDSAVVDARPISRQALAPVPGRASRGYNAQIAVSTHQVQPGPFGVQREVLRFFDIEADGSASENGGVGLSAFHGGDPGDPVPEIEPFALDGRVELGDPVQGSYKQLEPSVILNAPPTHFDILDGEEFDANFCYQGDQYAVPPVCFFESEYERESSASTEVTSESTEDWAVSAKATAGFNILGAVDIEAELRGGYGENYKDIGVETRKDTVTVTVKSRNTDKIYAIKREYDTLEYPVYAPGVAEPAQFVLSTTPHTVARQWFDSSSPEALSLRVTHQPGNILSYPEDRLSGENPFISPTDNPAGGMFADTFARDDFELSDYSDYKYALTDERMTEDSAATEKKWNIGATAKASGSVLSVVDVSLEVSGDYSSSDLDTTKTTVGTTTRLTSTMGGIDESFGEAAYTVKPFAFWTASATLVLDYAVEPSLAEPGDPKTWWQLKYGSKPDLTLNLPRLLDFEEQAGISSDAARFISPGVEVLKGCDASDAACGAPCADPRPLTTGSAGAGETLCLRAQVQNYSLKDQVGGSTVQFYDADPDVGGEPIGDPAPVNPIPARDSAIAITEWTPDSRFSASRPRIFAVVDSNGSTDEIHEDNNKGFRSYRALADTEIALRAPQDVVADSENGRSVDVEWDVPDAIAAQPPHEWFVSAYPESGGSPISVTVASDERAATLPDLPPDRYRVTVFSTAAGESSSAAHPSEPVSISTGDPGAPDNLQATAGNASVQLSWDPPQDTGGGPIDVYRIREYRSPGQSFPQAPVETTVAGDVTALTLSGLTNGRPYRFTVQAVNGRGGGELSAPSAEVTPLDVPDRPLNVRATGGMGGSAGVTWDPPPTDPERAAVTGYEITASPGGATRTVGAGTEELDFDGLQTGQSYTFRVRADSEVGFGAESQPSGSVISADAPSAPRNLSAGPSAIPGSARLQWEQPESDGGVPIASYEACLVGGSCQRVPANRTDASFPGVPTDVPLTFEVSARNEAGLDSPTAQTTSPVVLDDAPTVELTKAPAESSFTGPDVVVAFEATPAGADTECVVDGTPRPCRSPFRMNGLRDGSHTLQVEATSTGGTVATPMVAWDVDSLAPEAVSRKLRKLIRKGTPAFEYRGADQGGSGIAKYEVRTRRAGKRGKFKTDPDSVDPTGREESSTKLEVAEGETVCASVRSVDGAGNPSAWTKERCTTKPFDESSLRKDGKWRKIRGKKFSNRHALQAKRDGASLNFLIGRTSKVKVLAGRCSACGKLAVEVRGHRRKVIDLSKTRKRKSSVTVFNARWPKSKDGRLRLISLGGGKVRVDGVAVLRSTK